MDSTSEGRFLIQVEQEAGGARLQADTPALVEGSDEQIEAAADLARRASDRLGDLFKGTGPDSGSIEFGLTFEIGSGVPILAKGKVGTSITVTLNWEKG